MKIPQRLLCSALGTVVALTFVASPAHSQQCDVYFVEHPRVESKSPHWCAGKKDAFTCTAKSSLKQAMASTPVPQATPIRLYEMEPGNAERQLTEAVEKAVGADGCDCIRKFVIVGHGEEGALSVGCGAVEDSKKCPPADVIRNNTFWWLNFFRDQLRPKLCIPADGIYLYGCGVGVCNHGASLVATLAELTGTNVFAPTKNLVRGSTILDYIENGSFQVARPIDGFGSDVPVPSHESASIDPAPERRYAAQEQYQCPCDNAAYPTVSECAQNCEVSLGCFTNICEAVTVNDRWLSRSGEPVLEAGPEGSWDESGVSTPTLLRASPYSMWFLGWNSEDVWSIGYATSPYALTWTKHPQNPVLTSGPPGSWEDDGVYGPVVIKDEGTYKMWYIGYSASDAVPRIGYATSTNGADWEKHPQNPVLDIGEGDAWDFNGVSDPTVIKSGDLYMMWYAGHDGAVFQIGYATSRDGIVWEKSSRNPVLAVDQDRDIWSVQAPSVVEDDGTFRMLYVTTTFEDVDSIRYTSTSDPASWVHTSDAPHFSGQPGERFDSEDVSHPSLLKDDNESVFNALYRGRGESNWSIGFGVATDLPAGTE